MSKSERLSRNLPQRRDGSGTEQAGQQPAYAGHLRPFAVHGLNLAKEPDSSWHSATRTNCEGYLPKPLALHDNGMNPSATSTAPLFQTYREDLGSAFRGVLEAREPGWTR